MRWRPCKAKRCMPATVEYWRKSVSFVGRYRFCNPVQTIQDAPHRPKGSRDDASDFRRPVSNNVVKNPAEK